MPGRRRRVAIACADFPRVWPIPIPAQLTLFHGGSRIRLPVNQSPRDQNPLQEWGPLQAQALASANDLWGGQRWDIRRDLLTDTVSLHAAKSERIRLDPQTTIATVHAYGAAVSADRPELTARTVTTTHQLSVEVAISIDGQPCWSRTWRRGLGD